MQNIPNYYLQIKLFHGTNEVAARKIITTKGFNIGTKRKDHWLGQGVYFYREDYKQALFWAHYKIKGNPKLRGQAANVIEVDLMTNTSEFLNLDTRDGLDILDKHLVEFSQFTQVEKMEIETDDPIMLRCLLCDMLPDTIKVIQRTFPVESKYFDKTKFKQIEMSLNGVQVCIRDPKVINQKALRIVSIGNPSLRKTNTQHRPRLIEFKNIVKKDMKE